MAVQRRVQWKELVVLDEVGTRDIHSKLTEQKEKQNSTEQKQNKTEPEQKQREATVHTKHIRPNAEIFQM